MEDLQKCLKYFAENLTAGFLDVNVAVLSFGLQSYYDVRVRRSEEWQTLSAEAPRKI